MHRSPLVGMLLEVHVELSQRFLSDASPQPPLSLPPPHLSLSLSLPQPPQVTRLERDASSGTALQETSFWLNLENALNKIHQKRHSPEVTLTLDVLKAGKRFHATVSFDSDTGKLGLIKHRLIQMLM